MSIYSKKESYKKRQLSGNSGEFNLKEIFTSIIKNITATNKYESDLGRKLENVVYFELLRRGGKVYVGKHQDREIDFVVHKANNEVEYYQIAYTVNDEKTFKREISAFDRIRDNYPKYLLTLDFDTVNIDGIQKTNVIDWLLSDNQNQ
jgi:predicted AAA+ superfamily ATPase